MTKHRNLWLAMGFAALLGLSGSSANAATVTVELNWGTGNLTFTSNLVAGMPSGTPYAVVTTDGNIAFTNALSSYLSGHGSDLSFAAGAGVSTNILSATQATGATLSQGGQLNFTSGGTSDTLTITTFVTGYTTPSGNAGTIAAANNLAFTNGTAASNGTINNYYDSSNTGTTSGAVSPSPFSYTSTGVMPNSGAGSSNTGISSYMSPFALVSSVSVTMTSSGAAGAEYAQYNASTAVTANGVPEPASIIMMLTGMPVPMVVLGMLRRRKAATKA